MTNQGMTDSTMHSRPGPADSSRPSRSLQYQSFPDASGDSLSLDKLKALRLPVMVHKRFLDLGCNEGFFCGFALYDGATEAVGIDTSAEFIARARRRFPAGRFLHQSWDSLPTGPFDVILLASALHYAADQPALVARSMAVLGAGGCLVLELGVAVDEGTRWVEVHRGIDKRLFPTMGQLAEMLMPYAWKLIGPSVSQAGDPVPRFVVHVTHRKPMAWVMLQHPAPGMGKTAVRLFDSAGIPVVSGLDCIRDVASGALEAPQALREVLAEPVAQERYVAAVRKVAKAGLMPTLMDVWFRQAKGKSFALLAHAPDEYCNAVLDHLRADGYLVSVLTTPRVASISATREELREVALQERAKPMAWLMMQPPAAGKTSIARALFRPAGVAVVSGDVCIKEITSGTRRASERLKSLLCSGSVGWQFDIATRQVLSEGLLPDLVQVWLDQVAGESFALDSFVPEAYHAEVEKCLRTAGYRVTVLTISGTGTILEPLDMTQVVADSYLVELSRSAQKREVATPSAQENAPPFAGLKFVDEVTVRDGHIVVNGWAINEDGVLPTRLDLLIDGASAAVQHLVRVHRPDVEEVHKTTGEVGFRISVPVPEGLSLEGLAGRVDVMCSDTGVKPRGRFAGTIGFVDHVRLEKKSIVVFGWAVHQDGAAPRALDLRIDGKSLESQHLLRFQRPDLKQRWGDWSADIGYRISIPIPPGLALEGLEKRIEVFGGPSASELSGPFWSIPAGRLPRRLPG